MTSSGLPAEASDSPDAMGVAPRDFSGHGRGWVHEAVTTAVIATVRRCASEAIK